MLTAHLFALILACVCFVLASKPPAGLPVRLEWLGAAFVVLAWMI
jgi:hypothetical protein